MKRKLLPILLIALVLSPVVAVVALHYDWWGKLTQSSSEGRIMINTPSVYTRQRLVNDRLLQSAWLQKQLDVTEQAPTEFRVIDEVHHRTDDNSLAAKVIAGLQPAQNGTAAPRERTASENGASPGKQESLAAPPSAASTSGGSFNVQPTSTDLFRAMNTYREEVRSELMQTLLDDRHDILGNTLYRLAMDVTVLPGSNLTDLALVTIVLRHDESAEDYEIVYRDWVGYLQTLLDRSITGLAAQFTEPGHPLDPRVRVLLPYFLMDKLCQKVAQTKAARPLRQSLSLRTA